MSSRATGRRAWAVLASALLALLLAALGSTPTAAEQRGSLLQLDVTAIDGTVPPAGGMRIVTEVTNGSTERRRSLTLTASVHSRVVSRYEYQRAVDERELGAALATWSVDVDPVGAGATSEGALRLTDEDLAAVRAHGPGVYPLELALVDDGVAVDGVVTALVVAPDEVDQPLRVGVVAPFQSPPPGGESLLDRRDRAVLTRLATGLDAGVPVTVAVDGLVLDEAARLADGGAPPGGATLPPAAGWSDLLAAVTGLAEDGDVELIPRPYAAADLTALVRGGMTAAAIDAVRDSRAAIARHAGVEPADRMMWPAAGLDGRTLHELADDGLDAVILDEEHLSIPSRRELPTSPSPVRPLAAGGGPFTAVVPDPWLSAALQAAGRQGTALATQRLLAETAVVFFERPFATDPRGVVIAGRPGTASDRHVAPLLDGMAAAPWLEPLALSDLLRQLPPDETPAQLRASNLIRSDELDPGYVATLGRARERLAGVASSIEEDDGAFDDLARDLRVAASTWFRDAGRSAAGLARIRRVEEAVGAVEQAITVADLPVTLASIEGELPVTLHSDATVPLRVRVSAESQRYEFDGGAEQRLLLEPGSATTALYRVRALAPGGTHPVRVTVTDDRGAVVLAQGTVVVRSTAVSVVALVLTVGAALFLGAWWLRDARRRRAAREAPADTSVTVVSGSRR